ncbi:MAG: tyrosine-type recombinase/integrase [Lysobacteraceae bacterium]
MRFKFTEKLVRQATVRRRPRLSPHGQLVWEDNPELKPWTLLNVNNENCPQGFYLRVGIGRGKRGAGGEVGLGERTYFLQRRVGATVRKIQVGNVSDFASLDEAYKKARELLQIVLDGRDLKVTLEDASNLDRVKTLTVIQALDDYRQHLVDRPNKKVKDSTLHNIDQARARVMRDDIGLGPIAIADLRVESIKAAWKRCLVSCARRTAAARSFLHQNPTTTPAGKKAFEAFVEDLIREKSAGLTATEQNFKWVVSAVNHAVKNEMRGAREAGREPVLTYNPFQVLVDEGFFRNKTQLEEQYRRSKTRNPLGESDGSLKSFLEALWVHRERNPGNRTAADYLLLTLLWGARRIETARLQWLDLVPEKEFEQASYVDLEERVVVFRDTKNHTDHTLPIADGAYFILRQRYLDRGAFAEDRQRWVFPARSKNATQGHYTDSKALLAGIRKTAGLEQALRTHDLRRTFGRFAEGIVAKSLASALANEKPEPTEQTRRLLNHKGSGSTNRYTQPEHRDLVDAMSRIERAMLYQSPKIYSILLGPESLDGRGSQIAGQP